jgi:hypothetical protein
LNSTCDEKDAPGRIVFLDHLRVFLVALVIAHHAAVGYGAAGQWYYVVPPPQDSLAAGLLTILAAVNQTFFMGLLFALSAYFTPPSYDKKGPAAYLKGRALRLGIPLFVYIFLLNPSLEYFVARITDRSSGGYFDFMRHNLFREAAPGPLWFVLSLIVFETVYACVRNFSGRRSAARRARAFPTNLQILAFVVSVGLATFLVRLAFPVGWAVFDLQLGYFPLYVCMYVLGVWAYRSSWLDRIPNLQVMIWFGASIALILPLPLIMIAGGNLGGGIEEFYGGFSREAAVYAFWEPVLCVGISLMLLALFQRWFNTPCRLCEAAARSSYAAYIIHPFVVVPGTYFFSELPLNPLVKFSLLAPLAVALSFAIADGIRRAPILREVL